MRPHFSSVYKNFPSEKAVTRKDLFQEIGWDDLVNNDAYVNTCAIRVSLALVKSGVRIRGRIKIHKGPSKGKLIEPGQAKLSTMLSESNYFGAPEKFKSSEADAGIGGRHGIISFWKIPGYLGGNGGHIDIVSAALGGIARCGSNCYWNSSEVWFWSLA